MESIDALLSKIDRLSPGGLLVPEIAEGLEHLAYDEDMHLVVWKGAPATEARLARLSKALQTSDLPAAVRALLARHDGIAVLGMPEGEMPPAGAIDPDLDHAVCSIDGVLAALATFRALEEAGRAPSGLLPFFCHDRADVAYDCVVVDPADPAVGQVIRVFAREDAPPRPSEVESHPVVATDVAQWLERWIEAGLDALRMTSRPVEVAPAAHGSVQVGDVFTLPSEYGPTGEGFHWASRVVDLDGDGRLWIRFFTVAYSTRKPAPAATRLPSPLGLEAKVVPLDLCARVDGARRDAIIGLIAPDVLAALPGVRQHTTRS